MDDYFPDSAQDTIIDRLDVLIRALDACAALSTALLHPMLAADRYGYTVGKKYVRVWYDMSNGQRFVAFFVEKDTGDVWKAAGWKGPALNFVRGNINSPEGRTALTYGRMRENGRFYSGF